MGLDMIFFILLNRNGLLPYPWLNLTKSQLYQKGKSLEHYYLLCYMFIIPLNYCTVMCFFQWIVLASWIRNHIYEVI